MGKRLLWLTLAVLSATAVVAADAPPASTAAAREKLAAAGKPYHLKFEDADENGAVYSLEKVDAQILVPVGYHLVPAVHSEQVNYDFAVKHDTKAYEVRFRFDAMHNDAKAAADCKAKNAQEPGSCFMADLDAKSDAWASTFRANLSGGEDGRLTFFPDAAVDDEFGGDWGLTSDVFDLKDKDFAGPYALAQFTQIHRNGVGTFTVIRAAKDIKTLADLNLSAFHVVRFAPRAVKRP
jgi:hypothetical protein